jgi:hypothetical protein
MFLVCAICLTKIHTKNLQLVQQFIIVISYLCKLDKEDSLHVVVLTIKI